MYLRFDVVCLSVLYFALCIISVTLATFLRSHLIFLLSLTFLTFRAFLIFCHLTFLPLCHLHSFPSVSYIPFLSLASFNHIPLRFVTHVLVLLSFSCILTV